MSGAQRSPVGREALDEFIRQLFACNWVLGQMIAGMVERARAERHGGDQEPMTGDAYSMIRDAIGGIADRHGARQIEAATALIDEVMDGISNDSRIFPADPVATRLVAHPHSARRRVRRRRR